MNSKDCNSDVQGKDGSTESGLIHAASIQTDTVTVDEKDCQASSSQEVEVQTDDRVPGSGAAAALSAEAEERLASFLKRVESQMLRELDRATRTQSQLRAAELAAEEEPEPAVCLHTLSASAQTLIQGLQEVSCLSWSPSGAVIAAGHGWAKHDAWCSHSSEIHLYNINLQYLDPDKPSQILESPSCLTTLQYHPKIPALLAAGSYSGELLIWSGDGANPIRAGASEGHGEALSGLVWASKGQQWPQALLSAGLDGRLLTWRLESPSGPLTLQHSFSIGCEHLPNKVQSGDDFQPVTSLALLEAPCCLVGTQAGCVLLCDLRDPTKEDPVVLKFRGHEGAVTSITTHPSNRQLFASCGSDNEIRIYNVKQEVATRVIPCSRQCAGVSWSREGSCLAWWGGGCEVEVLALQGDTCDTRQLATLEPGDATPRHVTALCFNPALPQLVAVGDKDARVRIWKVPLPN